MQKYTDKVVQQIRGKLYEANLLPLRKQAKIAERILEERLTVFLPKLMEETGIDMWVVAGHETNEDPVMWTMTMPGIRYSRRQSALIFYRDPKDGHMERMVWMIGYAGMQKYYREVGNAKESLSQVLERECERLDPQKIGININSELGGFCGGLSAWMYNELKENLSEKYRERLYPAGRLATRWLEIMTPEEMKVMEPLSEVTEDIMRAFFNRELIVPGKTTVEDVKWFIKDVMARCELNFWFDPHLDYQREGLIGDWYGPKKPDDNEKKKKEEAGNAVQSVIEEGDLLHCDVGVNLKYIRVLTDRQWMCYLKKAGEDHAPEGMKKLFKIGNQFQDLVCEGFLAGRKGNEVFWDGVNKAKEVGIQPVLYCHGLGTYGHSAGPIIGLIDCQGDIFPRGELPVAYGSVHALELQHIAELPEWGNQKIHIYLEEDVQITDKPHYIGERETELMEI